jgi:hypothetical protein
MKLFAPLSLIWFLITAVVVGLQHIPMVGLFMMMLAAPFWSVITINLGFVGIAAEALVFRWTPRWWAVLPALWFGGYAVWVVADQVAARRAEAVRPGAVQAIAFDPSRADLVVVGPGARAAAGDLVHAYDLSVVYSVSPGPGSRTPTEQDPTIAHRIAPLEACEDLGRGKIGLAQQDIQREQMFVRGRQNAYCQYTVPETPRRAPIRATVEPDPRYEPQRGVLPLFPMPLMGCALNSNMPRWECDYRFIRVPARNERAGPVELPADRLASRLGLKPRRGVVASPETQGPAAVIAAAVAGSERNLERLISDPTLRFEEPAPLAALEDRPDILGRHADRIVGTLERHWDDPEAASAVMRLTALLSYLSDADLERLAPRLRALHERPTSIPGGSPFLSRLRERLDLRPHPR